MSGLKKVFSTRRSRQPNSDQVPPERPEPPRIPSFKENRYEDAAQGSKPIVGLLPLRGNRAFAVRHDDGGILAERRYKRSSMTQDKSQLERPSATYSTRPQDDGRASTGYHGSDTGSNSGSDRAIRQRKGENLNFSRPKAPSDEPRGHTVITDLGIAKDPGHDASQLRPDSRSSTDSWATADGGEANPSPGQSDPKDHTSKPLEASHLSGQKELTHSTEAPSAIGAASSNTLLEPPPRISSLGNTPSLSSSTASPASLPDLSPEEVTRRAGYSSTKTTVHESVNPAVTHETVTKTVHHIREDRIYREIHTHDVYHRILPIVDVQVLPTRHVRRQEDGSLVRMAPHEVPKGRKSNWAIAETVSTGEDAFEPRSFTAREFPGTEGDERTYMTEEGFPRKETTWVHPPVLEPGARETGQTVGVEL